MKKVLVACASGIATSTLIVNKLSKLFRDQGVKVEIVQCSYGEVNSYVKNVDLIVTTQKFPVDFKKPTLIGFAYLTGMGEAELNGEIMRIINES